MERCIISYRRPSRYEPGKTVNVILGETTSVHSLASLVLLSDYFRRLEVNYWAETLQVDLRNPEFNKAGNYGLLKILRHVFNRRFLENKPLFCEYCSKPILLSDEGVTGKAARKHNSATVDHKVPLIEDCDWFDESNLISCCYKCNNEKQDMPYQDWLKKINKSFT